MKPSISARAVALAVYLAAVAMLLATILIATGGELVFPLDDAYIHFSIARTVADAHVYGLQPGDFSSPSSSLAWPLLLAAVRWLGVPLEWAALSFGILAGVASLVVVDDVLAREGMARKARVVATLAIGALVPLVPMAVLGMEHAAHIAVVLALVAETLRRSAEGDSERIQLRETPSPSRGRVFGLSFLAVSLRYEGAFVVGALIIVLLVAARARHWRARDLSLMAALGAGGGLPVLLAALFFVSHGGPWLPASVVLKRTHVALSDLPTLLVRRAIEQPHVPALLALLGVATAVSGRGDAARRWAFVGAVALLAQTTLAQLGWLYRYEAYAVAIALVALVLAWRALGGRKVPAVAAVVTAALLLPAGLRAAFAHGTVPMASRNVAEQQMQIARFVRHAAPLGVVAVNDVGAVAYFGGGRVLDLLGLADLRIARARGMRIDSPLSRSDVDRFTKLEDVRLAVLYEPWFIGAIPEGWVLLERWRIHQNRVCAFDTVSFFATSAAVARDLQERLDAFRPRLPAGVDVIRPTPLAVGLDAPAPSSDE